MRENRPLRLRWRVLETGSFGAPRQYSTLLRQTTDSLNICGQGSVPPLTPQAIDREGRHAKSFLSSLHDGSSIISPAFFRSPTWPASPTLSIKIFLLTGADQRGSDFHQGLQRRSSLARSCSRPPLFATSPLLPSVGAATRGHR